MSELEIQKTIEKMKAIRSKIRPFSMFGNDNLAMFDICLEVLEEDLDDDDIMEQWDIENDYDSWSIANITRQWLDGEDDDFDPINNWPLL